MSVSYRCFPIRAPITALTVALALAPLPRSAFGQSPVQSPVEEERPTQTTSLVVEWTLSTFDEGTPGLWGTLGRFASVVPVLYVGMEMTDEPLRQWAQGSRLQDSGALGRVASAFDHLGTPIPVLSLGATYLVARATDRREIQDVAWHVGEGLAISGTVTGIAKALFGRARPYHTSGEDADVFDPSQGIRANTHYNSFPSGHATMAFALAAGISAEAVHRWPNSATGIKVASYSAAGLTGFARIYKDRHWGTDVLVGALLGHWMASRVVARAHGEGAALMTAQPFFGAGDFGGVVSGITLRFD